MKPGPILAKHLSDQHHLPRYVRYQEEPSDFRAGPCSLLCILFASQRTKLPCAFDFPVAGPKWRESQARVRLIDTPTFTPW